MLILDNIQAVYLNVVLALNGVSMRVEDGTIAVLLGNNGSGKSTTLKSISGVLALEEGKLKEGKVELDGKRIDKLNPEQIARLGTCHVLQGHPVFDELTAEENLLMGAFLQKDTRILKQGLEEVYQYFPRLRTLRNRKSGFLSGGEQQMLVIGRALMARPRLMLLDEPSMGLAPRVVREIFTVINSINQERKTTFLIAEQNASAVLSIADYGYILQNGKVVMEGPAELLKTHHDVKKSYLGLESEGMNKNYYALIREKRTKML